MFLAMMVMVLPIITSVYYDIGDEIGYFIEYLLYL
jgi:ABC-type phosphate transport system permease subunit